MPKKLCCCTDKETCPWCDKGSPYQTGPVPYNALTGTVTTEMPSIGHPYIGNAVRQVEGICADAHFRTIPPESVLEGVSWTADPTYGDIYPCWFNGIDMNQKLTSTETNDQTAYFEFLFKLKIQKRNDNGVYENIIDIDWNGYGKNLRPHPDACKSFNVTYDEFANICDTFQEVDGCKMDFARMPRGPWPYRLKTGIAPPGDPNQGNEIELDELSDEGTPYGWEDCPDDCPSYSNYGSPTEKLKFFKWMDPISRYTTPEWDVSDFTKGGNRKLSIHCIVPTKPFEEDYVSGNPWCTPQPTFGKSFGEWCFGMDLECFGGEIQALENAGFNWSNGREEKGLWINKTPTNALRVLFTLDHSDIDIGKVFRVFRDWNVKNGTNSYLEWTNNDAGLFRIQFEQKVTERIFSSFGCDCPEANCERNAEINPPTEGLWNCLTCRYSFTERGPIFVKMAATTKRTGRTNDPTNEGCDEAFYGTEMCEDSGLIMFADSPATALSFFEPAVFPDFNSINLGTPFLDCIGDTPLGPGRPDGTFGDGSRYRSLYRTIRVEQMNYGLFTISNPFPYGYKSCTTASGKPTYNDSFLGNKEVYAYPLVKITPWVLKHQTSPCTVLCGCPSLPNCANCFTNGFSPILSFTDDGGGPAPLFEPADPPGGGGPSPCDDCTDYNKCNNAYDCVNNLVREHSYGALIGSSCVSSPPLCDQAYSDQMGPYCPIPFGKIGVDCNLIYFNAFTSVATYGGYGPEECAKICGEGSGGGGNNSNCFDSCGNCKFCYSPSGIIPSAGFLNNTTINWRELLCYRAKNNPDKLKTVIPYDIMSKLHIKCEMSGSCPNEYGQLKNIFGRCDCEFFNTYGNSDICTPTDNVVNKSYFEAFESNNLDIYGQEYEINFSPYTENGIIENNFKGYSTKYKEQTFSPRFPTHLNIISQGPIIA